MKAILYSLTLLFVSGAAWAEEPAAPCAKCAMKSASSTDETLDQLLAQMNGSTGEEKISAMAALINQLVQQRKAMAEKMAKCEMMQAGKEKDPAAAPSPAPAKPGDPAKPSADPHAGHKH